MKHNINTKINNFSPAFTIIELLVVIVIIGILATITIVSYFGIKDKAIESSLKSQLSSASRSLKAFQVEYDNYPTTIDCTIANSSTNLCLKPGDNATYTYQVDNTADPQTFKLYIQSQLNSKIFLITNDSEPIGVDSMEIDEKWTQVSVKSFACGIISGVTAYCWGNNGSGQLGNNTTVGSLVPAIVDTSGLTGKTIKFINTGGGHTCAIASDDKAYCWGFNTYGQLGNNSTTNSSVPVAVNTSGVLSGKTIKSISAGYYHTCAIASDDQTYCWGYNAYGQLGNNSTTNSSVPVAVNTSGVLSGKTINAMSSRYNHVCVVASDNKAYCWGYNNKGQLGNNSTINSLIPVAVDTTGTLKDKNISTIDVGSGSTCVLTSGSSNQLHCWGSNSGGVLGNDSTTDSLVPVRAVYPGS